MTSSSIIYFNQVLFGCLFYFGFYLFKLMFIYHLTCLLFFKSLGLSILIRYQHKLYALYFLLHMIAKVSGCGLNLSIHQFIHPFMLSIIYSFIYLSILFIHITELYSLTTTTSLKQQQNPLLNNKFYLNLQLVLIQKPHPLILMHFLSSLVQKDLVLPRLNVKLV